MHPHAGEGALIIFKHYPFAKCIDCTSEFTFKTKKDEEIIFIFKV